MSWSVLLSLNKLWLVSNWQFSISNHKLLSLHPKLSCGFFRLIRSPLWIFASSLHATGGTVCATKRLTHLQWLFCFSYCSPFWMWWHHLGNLLVGNWGFMWWDTTRGWLLSELCFERVWTFGELKSFLDNWRGACTHPNISGSDYQSKDFHLF